jgi:hypothetical protein
MSVDKMSVNAVDTSIDAMYVNEMFVDEWSVN